MKREGDLPHEIKNTSQALKAFGLYFLLMAIILGLPMYFIIGPFADNLTRSWMVSFIVLNSPVSNLRLRLKWSLLLSFIVGCVVIFGQGYLANELHGYSPKKIVLNGWLLMTLAYYFASAVMSAWIVRRLIWDKFALLPSDV